MLPAVNEHAVPRDGDVLGGRYRVDGALGEGGMGVVLAATDATTGARVALKLVRNVARVAAVERFFREARAMSALASRHVVRVCDMVSSDGAVPFLVMERLDGTNLSDRVRTGGPCSIAEVAGWILQACEALSHAHSQGIVHRDIKPSNLFLHRDAEGEVLKVLDFGISKVAARGEWEHTLTASGDEALLGSPPYMSPEQTRDPSGVDARTDQYALGVVMYKLLVGRVPFDGRTVGEIFASILENPYPSLIPHGIPAGVDAIVARCLAKDRRERFAHVGELATALARFATPAHAALAPAINARLEHTRLEHVAMSEAVPEHTLTLRELGPPPTARTEPPPPAKPRAPLVMLLVGVGVLGIAGGIVSGAVRGLRASPSLPATSAPVTRGAQATATSMPVAAASVPVAATSAPAAPVPDRPPAAVVPIAAPRPALPIPRRRPPPRVSAPPPPVAPPPPGAPPPATASARSTELQPSPYPDP
jgi:serine/threonine-protein kinase